MFDVGKVRTRRREESSPVTDEVQGDVDGPAMQRPHQRRHAIVVHSGEIRTLVGQKRNQEGVLLFLYEAGCVEGVRRKSAHYLLAANK